MAWTEADRVKLRHYMGFGAIFLQAFPILENAIRSVQSIADGGTRPDNSTETFIRAQLTDLATIEQRLKDLWVQAQALGVEETKVDPYRGMAMLRKEGRRLVAAIATALSMTPRRDAFSDAPPSDLGNPFPDLKTSARY